MKRTLSAFVLLTGAVFAQDTADLKTEVTELRALVLKLQSRVDQLEARTQAPAVPAAAAALTAPSSPATAAAPAAASGVICGTTLQFLIYGYFRFNFYMSL